MSEIEEMKADIREIKTDQKEVIKAVNDLQLLVAGQYVTKEEFKEHERSDNAVHSTLHGRITNTIIGVSGAVIMFLLKMLWDLVRG